MSDLLLLSQNLSSIILVISAWFLAHQEALRKPPGRLISTACALVGFAAFAAGVARNWPTSPEVLAWLIEVSKYAIAVAFILIGYRQCRDRSNLRTKSAYEQRRSTWDH